MQLSQPFLDKIGFPILLSVFVLLFILESVFGLRMRVQSRWKRIFINGGVSLVAFSFLRLLFIPAMVWLSTQNQEWHFGLNYLYELPAWLEFFLAFIILDYSNYLWHILNHQIPLLWRFHNVHHTDLDLDVTTALRFHFGELIGSVFFRGAAVLLTGASPMLVLTYEIVFEAATAFHHSNWKIPFKVEKILNKLVVTPRMHGIHHSIIRQERDSNYSVIFSFWDRIHRTIELDVPQQSIIIGVPDYRDPSELTFLDLILMPFKKLRKWQLFDAGIFPQNKHALKDKEHLME
jgi:sterol desaturase/sphingolipid hydroxylase (fatty acid hydroxylase superfamily)